MSGYLLDIDLLLALFSQEHKHYEHASHWFANNSTDGWATCSLSDVEYAETFSGKAFSVNPVSTQDAISLLKKAKQLPNYSFWNEPFNCLTSPEYGQIFAKAKENKELKGAYLVAIAKYNGGKLATFNEVLANKYPEDTVLVL